MVCYYTFIFYNKQFINNNTDKIYYHEARRWFVDIRLRGNYEFGHEIFYRRNLRSLIFYIYIHIYICCRVLSISSLNVNGLQVSMCDINLHDLGVNCRVVCTAYTNG